jgi:hypothetical protein
MFATEEDMKMAQSKPIMFNNFRLYWINGGKKEIKRRETIREERGRSWDRFSQVSDIEDSKSREREQKDKIYINKTERRKNTKVTNWKTEERRGIHNQIAENQTRYKQKENTYVEEMLGRIWERLEKLEEARGTVEESSANRS